MEPKLSRECLIHQECGDGETVKAFSTIRWEKFRQCADKWLTLDGTERSLAETARSNGLLDACGNEIQTVVGFHDTCYRRFIDSKIIKAAEKRCRGIEQKYSQDEGEAAVADDEEADDQLFCCQPSISPKKLRSTSQLRTP